MIIKAIRNVSEITITATRGNSEVILKPIVAKSNENIDGGNANTIF